MLAIVSGATSMIGASLIRKCLKEDMDIVALVRKNSSRLNRLPISDRIQIVEYNLDEIDDLRLENISADVFYHFAWAYTSKDTRDNPYLQEKNIKYTLDMVNLAHKCGCKVFVGAGSQAEYGVVSTIIDENTNTNPQIAYGMAKLSACMLAEKLCRQYDIKFIWGRIFSVYGINDNENTLINYIIDSFNNGEKVHLSSCEQIWNYLNEIDVGNIFFLLGIYNVSSGIYCVAHRESKPLRYYIETICDIYNNNVNCEYSAKGIDNNKTVQLNVDTSKLYSNIEYKEQISFENGIKAIVNYKNRM